MTAFYIVLSIFLLLLLVFFIPFRFVISASDSFIVYIKFLIIRYRVYPENPNRKKKRIKKAGLKKTLKKEKTEEKEEAPAGIADTISLVTRVLKKLVEKAVGHFKIRLLQYEIIVSTDDAAKTAILYGVAAQLTSYLLDYLYNHADFKVKKNAKFNVRADYIAGKSAAKIKIAFSMCLFDALRVVLPTAIAYVRARNENKDKIKADTAGKAEDSCRKTK